jgi:hypothetical protein
VLKRPETRETIVHFMNFDRAKKLAPFRATIRKQFPGAVKSVERFGPDADNPVKVEFQESGDQITLTVPAMAIYSMLVVAQ